jgi:hypothetical protein
MEWLLMIDNWLTDAGEVSTASLDQMNFFDEFSLVQLPSPLILPACRLATNIPHRTALLSNRECHWAAFCAKSLLESRPLEVIERVDQFDAIVVGQHGFIPLLSHD